jgi:lysophospholipase L1-like esterase
MRRKLLILKLTLLITSVAFTLTTLELLTRFRVRAWPFDESLSLPEHLTSRDATLRWRFPPAPGRNALGLRNREVGPKPADCYRILVLGDSLVWSGETSSGPLYTEMIERRLNARAHPGGKSFEVINAGVPGYTTYQELEFLKIYGLDMQPDAVVLAFVFNDLYYPYLHKSTSQNLLGPEPMIRRYRFDPDRLLGRLFGRSYLAHDIVYAADLLFTRLRRPIYPFERRVDFYLAWKEHGWVHTAQLIGEMQALLARRGVPLNLLVFPVSDQVTESYLAADRAYVLYPQERIRRICAERGIPLLDLTEPIRANGGVSLFRDYLHLNGKGNDVVVDQVEQHLVRALGL